jgi:adenine-specific DNA-methyltransferase
MSHFDCTATNNGSCSYTHRAEGNAAVNLVDNILAAKRADPSADTSAWEREIDQLVYRLYGLTPEAIKIVKGKG